MSGTRSITRKSLPLGTVVSRLRTAVLGVESGGAVAWLFGVAVAHSWNGGDYVVEAAAVVHEHFYAVEA